jgi:hypothetical protein
MLLIYSEEASFAKLSQEEVGAMIGAYGAYTAEITGAGAVVSSNRLQSVANATSVRGQEIHDGPFAETKEQLAGYYLIEAPDLDAALAWAKKCPGSARGCVEVRPIFEMPTG